MAQAANTELVEKFEQFYRDYYREEIGELARKFPNDQRSLYVDWQDLYRFDADLADDYLQKPEQLRDHAEEALRLYDLPVDVKLGGAHVRVHNIDRTTEIRAIRSRHVNTLIAVQGLVRKATDVRPKIQNAAFECQRCGTLTPVPQDGADYEEPHECQGCERQGPFRLNVDQSEFVDSQQIRVQESPEGLRGGETPQSIDVAIEDDLPGEVTPGDHVTVTGILRLDQSGDQDGSPVFDTFIDGIAVEIEDEQFEDMEITEADKQAIIEESNREDVYDRIVGSIAPSIYGYDDQKLAMALQLFSGVTKHLPDGSRIRGDLHILFIGDPGTGKCLKGDTKVTLADGTERPIRAVVEDHLDDPVPVDDGVYEGVEFPVPSMAPDGSVVERRATKVWKREAPERMCRIRTASGTELEVTPSHPLFVQSGGDYVPVRAENLSEGDFVATPRELGTRCDDTLDVGYRRSKSNNAVRLDLPDEWTPSLARLIGFIVAEGYADRRSDNTGTVWITNDDREILDDVFASLEALGLNPTERHPHESKTVREVHCSSGEFVSFLENLEPALLESSADQRVPDALMRASPEVKAAFLRAYVDGEGHVSTKEREIAVASMSRELLENVRSLLLSQGVTGHVEERKNGSYRLRISGEDFVNYVESVGFVTGRKSVAATAFDGQERNTNTDVIPAVGDELRRIREALRLGQGECGVPRGTYRHYEAGDRNPSRESLGKVLDTFADRIDHLEKLRKRVEQGDWAAIESARETIGLSQRSLASEVGVTQGAVSQYGRGEVVPDEGRVTAAREAVLDGIDSGIGVADDVRALRELVDAEIGWDRIESIESVDPDYDWVYDLEVEGTHSYLSNNVVSHNSQLLQYIRKIAPRSVYTSGKGASTAGLTAAAVKDDFGDGQQWSLEAGALVLADRGIAAVDELDKMDSSDRSALHEGLEQQEISISKAGINATLKSRCALLGAANPKYGRFDQYEPIGEQIDLEPALISRFDLIFTVTDQPNEEEDRRLAEHILTSNYAGELNTQYEEMTSPDVSREEVEEIQENVDPTIDPDLLRKYVAYAKQNCHPRMTEEARAAIQEFYTDLRAKGTDEDAPVPITARKLEAMVRLAEASARVRLSDEVTIDDAERIISVVRSCLKDVGVDPESGEFDADVVETGTSKSQRDRIKNLKELIAEIAEEYEEGAPREVVVERAEEHGISTDQAEHEIAKLKEKGDIYETRTNHYRVV